MYVRRLKTHCSNYLCLLPLVLTLEACNEPAARLALDLFVAMLTRETGAAMAAIQGLDGIVFTAGIGEHSPEIRARTCASLGWAGVDIDEARNLAASASARKISTDQSRISVWVIPTNEEIVIARDTWQCYQSTN